MSGRRRYFLYTDLSTGLLAKNGMRYDRWQESFSTEIVMASGKKHYGKGLRVCEPSLSLSVKQLDKHNGGKTADALIDFANALSELFTPICFEAKLEREQSAFRRLNSFS